MKVSEAIQREARGYVEGLLEDATKSVMRVFRYEPGDRTSYRVAFVIGADSFNFGNNIVSNGWGRASNCCVLLIWNNRAIALPPFLPDAGYIEHKGNLSRYEADLVFRLLDFMINSNDREALPNDEEETLISTTTADAVTLTVVK